MKLNGQEVRFNMGNPKDARKVDEALKKLARMQDSVMSSDKAYTLEESMQSIINIYKELLKDCTGKDILKDCHDALQAQNVFKQFLVEVNRQKRALLSPFNLDRIH